MTHKYTAAELRLEILALEARSRQMEQDLKYSAGTLMTSLKPTNLIKSTFRSTVKAPGFGKNVLRGAAGLAAGFLSKKLFVAGSSSVIKKAIGTVVELGVAKAVAGNAENIASSGRKLMNKVIK